MPAKPEWVSITLYAVLYGTSRKTVYKWLDAGLLDSFRIGRCIRVRNLPPTDTRSTTRVFHNRPSRGKIGQTSPS